MDLPMPTELRHVYRALLRAATYLPDSAARIYVHNRVVQRFRSVSDRIRCEKNDVTRNTLITRYHGREHIQKTQQQARQLERAGLRSNPDLKKVLLHTYGRIGSRRRELIRKLLLPEEDSTSDTASLEKHIAERSSAGADQSGSQLYPPDSKVGSFLRSQKLEAPTVSFVADKVIKRLSPEIPNVSMWERPVPLKRQASMKRKHWKAVLDHILPPVPVHEWNRLRDLATGAVPVEDPPLRRSRPIVVEKLEGERNTVRLLDYFTTPVDQQRIRGRDTDEVTVNDDGATYWSKPRATVVIPERDLFTHSVRHMRRIYAGIWRLTPVMCQDEVTKLWITKWGSGQTAFFSGEVTSPREEDLELFEGAEKTDDLDNVGKRSRYKKSREKARMAEVRIKLKEELGLLNEGGYGQGVIASI